MKHYYISHMDDITKMRNIRLFQEIRKNGKFIKSEYSGDYYILTYEYQNKTWELVENMELGIMSEVIEIEATK